MYEALRIMASSQGRVVLIKAPSRAHRGGHSDHCPLCEMVTVSDGSSALVEFANQFPIVPSHTLLCPVEHRANLTESDCRAMAKLMQSRGPGVLAWLNRARAGASIPEHTHFQFVHHHTLASSALIRPHLSKLANRPPGVHELPDYAVPALGISLSCPDQLYKVASNMPDPFNLVFTNRTAAVIPRSLEQPAGFGTRFAGLEMAGVIVIEDAGSSFAQITGNHCIAAIQQCGVSKGRFDQIKSMLGCVIG